MYRTDQLVVGDTLTALGFEAVRVGLINANILEEIDMRVIPNNFCAYGNVCVGKFSSCVSAAGPLFTGKKRIGGVLSVYTGKHSELECKRIASLKNISLYLQWIIENTNSTATVCV